VNHGEARNSEARGNKGGEIFQVRNSCYFAKMLSWKLFKERLSNEPNIEVQSNREEASSSYLFVFHTVGDYQIYKHFTNFNT